MRSRGAYALLITIFLIISITLIVSRILDITDQTIRESGDFKRVLQLNFLTEDVVKILKKSPELNDINDSQDYDDMLSTVSFIPLNFERDMSVYINITHANDRININEIKSWNESQKSDFLSYIRNYEVVSAEYFWEILKDATDKKSDLTQLKTDMSRFYGGGIGSTDDFDKLLEYYIKNSKDYSILSVPWNKLICFSGKGININYMSCEVWKMIFIKNGNYDVGKDMCRGEKIVDSIDDLDISDNEINRIKKYNLSAFIPVVKVSVKLSSKDKNDKISEFNYDIKTKKVFDVSMAL